MPVPVGFEDLTGICRRLAVRRLPSEAGLERRMREHLTAHKIPHTSQVVAGRNRYDIICGDVCIELKLRAASADLDQFDRYLPRFPGGLIIVCWTATQTVRDVAEQVAVQSPTPVALVELSAFHSPV